jgi:hypothetical protein
LGIDKRYSNHFIQPTAKSAAADFVVRLLKMNKENLHFLNIANDIISSEFEKRNIQLQNNIEHIADKEAGRGFSIPTGSMIHNINQTCINELSSRFKFIWETLLKITENHSDKVTVLTKGINDHCKQQYEFIKKYIGNIKNTYALNSDPQSQSIECGLIELEQEYNRLAKHYQAEIQLAEVKHVQQTKEMKSSAKSEGPIVKIVVAVVIALLVGGSSPWWWTILFSKQTLVTPPPECSPDNLKTQLFLAGSDKPTVIKSCARTMRDRFRLQDFDCVYGLAGVLLQDDQDNGHGLYFSGEVWRVRAKQDPSRADFCRGRMREHFFRYLATEPSLAPSERDGDAAACYLREKGYCVERTAWINHLMAIDFYQQGQDATNKKIKLKRFERASEFVERALQFKQKDSQHKGFEQIYPSESLKDMIQEELQRFGDLK